MDFDCSKLKQQYKQNENKKPSKYNTCKQELLTQLGKNERTQKIIEVEIRQKQRAQRERGRERPTK